MPQQFYHFQGRNFIKGRGRGPRPPCKICGRTNHTTNYCYYRPSSPNMFQQFPQPQNSNQFVPQQFSQSYQSNQWRSPSTQVSPWMNSSPYPTGIPMCFSPANTISRPPQQPVMNQDHFKTVRQNH